MAREQKFGYVIEDISDYSEIFLMGAGLIFKPLPLRALTPLSSSTAGVERRAFTLLSGEKGQNNPELCHHFCVCSPRGARSVGMLRL